MNRPTLVTRFSVVASTPPPGEEETTTTPSAAPTTVRPVTVTPAFTG